MCDITPIMEDSVLEFDMKLSFKFSLVNWNVVVFCITPRKAKQKLKQKTTDYSLFRSSSV